jgi:hypothetical protein
MMNTQQAKEILSLYRPGTADAEDPSFAEALRLCGQDPELERWFNDRCAVYAAVREQFKRVAVPDGLKAQILSERKVHAPAFWRRPVVLAAAAAVVLFAGLWFSRSSGKGPGFSAYLDQMVSKAFRGYGMFETTSPEQVRAYLAKQQAPANFVVPENLQRNAKLLGCAAVTWEDKPTSMICFHSGKPLRAGQTTDLWLFVTERGTVPGAPTGTAPTLARVNTATTASWSEGGKTYVLIADGDEAFIRKYL